MVYPTETKHGNKKHLTGLSLFNAKEAAFYTLANAEGLEDLEFEATDLRVHAFERIGKLTSLKSLKAINCQLLPEQLTVLENLTNLEHLDLMFTIFNETSETRKERLGELSPAERKRYEALKGNDTGEHVIQAALLTDRIMPHLSKLTKLKTLRLINTFITADGLEHLSPLVELEVVQTGILGHTPEAFVPFHAMKNLRSLSYFNADDNIVAALSKISTLEYLNIWSGDVTDTAAANLATLQKLRRLEIRGNKMTNQGFQKLSQLPDLNYLDISYAKSISKKDIDQFLDLRPDVEIRARE